MCVSPLKETLGFGIVLEKDGLPHGIPTNQYFRNATVPELRFALTLLGISRILPGTKEPDLSTITSPSSGQLSPRLRDDLRRTVLRLKWSLPQTPWSECHITTKAGPNAQALVGSIEDAHLLTDDQISHLAVLGGDDVVQLINTIRS